MVFLRKQRISLLEASKYQLGIIWGCGSLINSEKGKIFVLRKNDKYFLEQVHSIFNNDIGFRNYKGKKYYILKTHILDFDELEAMNYSSRNADKRNVPILDNYKDFLRSYIELHGHFDYCTKYNRNKEKYYRLRFRIYGNEILIKSINNIIYSEIGCSKKSVQMVYNKKTAYIVFTKLDEIEAILNYISGEPYNEAFWKESLRKIKHPIKITAGEII